jgi:hypothetical protein
VGAKRPRAELIKLLAEQREALASSCEGFDRGNQWEANRLATTIFTLVHDGGSTTSLLTQLGLLSQLRFMSSGRAIDQNDGKHKLISASPPMVMIRMTLGVGTNFIPRLGVTSASPEQTQVLVQFSEWWTKELIYKDHGRELALSRRRLIFALRHQDGGAHIGELTDPAYVRLKEGAGWFGSSAKGPAEPMRNALAATTRQVAWEVTETLKQLGNLE